MYPILIATSLIETSCPAAATHHDAGPLVADGGTPAGEPDAGVVLGELDGGVLTACAPDQGARVEWCELGDIAHLDRACTADEINISSQAQLDAFLSSRAASGDDTVLALSVFGDSINDYSGLEKSGLRVVDLELEHVAVPELHFQNLTVLQEVIVSGDDALTSATFDGVQAWDRSLSVAQRFLRSPPPS